MSLTTEIESTTREEELARLARALRLARGFRLYFARSLPGAARRELLDDLASAVNGLWIFDAPVGLEHLRAELEFRLAQEPTPRAICVTGIEAWVPAGDEGVRSAFVRNLNVSRDRFAQTVPCPLVIWGADHVLQAIQRGAPDFFSVASGIYLFPEEAPNLVRETSREEATLVGKALWLRQLTETEARLQALDSEKGGTDAIDRIGLLNTRVVLLMKLALYERAEPLAAEAYKEARSALGEFHPSALKSANNLAYLYESTGRYAEAEPLYAMSLGASRELFGEEHPSTLLTANNLATLYEATGRYAEAEPLYVSTLEASRRTLGEDHPDTLRLANNLAGLYEATSRYADAEPLYRSTLEAMSRTLGSQHVNTLSSTDNLAYLYEATGRYAEAEPLYVSTLEASRRTLGEHHPDTLVSANNLASLYESTGRYLEAEALYAMTLEASRHALGESHPDTLTSANNLVYLYRITGRDEEGRALLERLIPSVRRLPEEHPVRRTIESNLQAWEG